MRSQQAGRSAPFPNAPEALASLRWLYPVLAGRLQVGNELRLDIGRHTRDGQRVEDALMWNVTLSGGYAPWRLRYFASLFNLLDAHRARTGTPWGGRSPTPTVPRYGRSARVGLTFSF